MEMEWNWTGKFSGEKIGGKCGGNGKEMEWKWNGFFFDKSSGKKIDGMEQEWNGIEMETFQ